MERVNLKKILEKKSNYFLNDDYGNDIYEEEESYTFPIESISKDSEGLDIEEINKILKRKKELKGDKKDKEKKGSDWLYKSIKRKLNIIKINGDVYFYNKKLGYYELVKDTELDSFIRWKAPIENKKYINRGIISETIAWIKSDREIEVDIRINEVDSERYINFKNCIYDICEDRILPHSEKYIFTSYIDCDYSSYSNSRGDVFAKYLIDSLGEDKDTWRQIQELLGVAISNYRGFKKAFFLLGPPNSGKSTLLEVLSELIGRRFCSNINLHDLNDKFRIASLKDKKINVVGEVSEINLKRLDIFKSLTGNDVIQAEFKGKDSFELKNKALMVFAGNSLPKLSVEDSNGAFFNRINVIVFKNKRKAEEIDYNLFDNLMNEREFIVNFALDGLRRLIKNNFKFSESVLSNCIKDNQYKKENSFKLFLKNRCELNIDGKISVKDLLNRYYEYCEEQSIGIVSTTDINAIIRSMENIKRKKMRINGVSVNGIEGIQIID